MDKTEIIRAYYDESVQAEWERLARHPQEFEMARRFLERYIQPGERVLDVGGGPGRYSLHFSALGCDVTLADLSDGNVAYARQRAAELGLSLRALQADAREIDKVVEGPFDHVLLMGPLYHLQQEADRARAVEACLRVLKPGGTLAASFISAAGGIIYSLKYAPEMILDPMLAGDYELFAQDKEFSGKSFTESFMIRVRDVLPFMARFPLQKLHFLGQEGLLAPNEQLLLAQPKEVLDRWLDLSERVCEREELLAFSEHFLYIGRKL